YEAHADIGLLELAADCSHAHTVEVVEELVALCRDLCEQGPRSEELDKARARMRWQLEAMYDSPGELAAFHGFAELFGLARTPRERLREFGALSPSAVRGVARRLFRAENLALLTVGTLPRAQSARLARAVAALR